MPAPRKTVPPEASSTPRPKTLSPRETKRLAATATKRATVPASDPKALHELSTETRAARCGTAGTLASGPRAVTCESCLALKVQAHREQDRLAARERYYARRQRELGVQVTPAQHAANNRAFAELAAESAALVRKPAVAPSLQDDSRHVRTTVSSEATVRPAQLVAAVEVMIASAHERRRRDEEAGRPADRFVWGQLEALRAVLDLVRLAAKERV